MCRLSISKGRYFASCYYAVYEDECIAQEVRPGVYKYTYHLDKNYLTSFYDSENKGILVILSPNQFIEGIASVCEKDRLSCSPGKMLYDKEQIINNTDCLAKLLQEGDKATLESLHHKPKRYSNEHEYRVVVEANSAKQEKNISLDLSDLNYSCIIYSLNKKPTEEDDVAIEITQKLNDTNNRNDAKNT